MISREDLAKQYGLLDAFASELTNLAESVRNRARLACKQTKEGRPAGNLPTPAADDMHACAVRALRCAARIDVMLNTFYDDERQLAASEKT